MYNYFCCHQSTELKLMMVAVVVRENDSEALLIVRCDELFGMAQDVGRQPHNQPIGLVGLDPVGIG